MAEKSLEIILRVKDLASQGLKSTGLAVDNLRNKLNNTTSKGGGLGDAAQSLEGLAKVAKVVGTIQIAGQAAQAAVAGIPVALALASGDLDKLGTSVDAFKQKLSELPLTIGLGFSVGNQIGQYLFGDEADAQKIQAEIDKVEEKIKRFDAATKKVASARSQAIGIGDTSRNVIRNLQTPEALRDQEQVNIDFEGQVKKIEEARAAAIAALRSADVNESSIADQTKVFDEQIVAAEQARNAKIQEIRSKHNDRIKGIIESGQQSSRAAAAAANEAELRLNGDALAAQLSQIRRNYDEQIKAKREAAAKLAEDPNVGAEARATIESTTQDEVVALARQRDAELLQAEREARDARNAIIDSRVSSERAAANEISDIEASLVADRLRMQGKLAEAAAAERKAQLEQRKRQIDQDAEARAKADPQQREQIIANAERLKALEQERYEIAVNTERTQARQRQAQANITRLDLSAGQKAPEKPPAREPTQRPEQPKVTRPDLSAGIPAPATSARGTSAAAQTTSGQPQQQNAARQAETASAGRMFELARPVDSLDKNVARLVEKAEKILQLVQRGGLVPLEV
jgi:hypothetical protein